VSEDSVVAIQGKNGLRIARIQALCQGARRGIYAVQLEFIFLARQGRVQADFSLKNRAVAPARGASEPRLWECFLSPSRWSEAKLTGQKATTF